MLASGRLPPAANAPERPSKEGPATLPGARSSRAGRPRAVPAQGSAGVDRAPWGRREQGRATPRHSPETHVRCPFNSSPRAHPGWGTRSGSARGRGQRPGQLPALLPRPSSGSAPSARPQRPQRPQAPSSRAHSPERDRSRPPRPPACAGPGSTPGSPGRALSALPARSPATPRPAQFTPLAQGLAGPGVGAGPAPGHAHQQRPAPMPAQ
jgi:hypothetical protein